MFTIAFLWIVSVWGWVWGTRSQSSCIAMYHSDGHRLLKNHQPWIHPKILQVFIKFYPFTLILDPTIYCYLTQSYIYSIQSYIYSTQSYIYLNRSYNYSTQFCIFSTQSYLYLVEFSIFSTQFYIYSIQFNIYSTQSYIVTELNAVIIVTGLNPRLLLDRVLYLLDQIYIFTWLNPISYSTTSYIFARPNPIHTRQILKLLLN